MSPARLVLLVGLALAAARPSSAEESDPRRSNPTISGVAELRMTTPESKLALRLLFSASGDPARLRIEVVRAGILQAIAWYDAGRLLVFAPTQGLVHEGPPTRQTLEDALGLPFCPADILHALRGGLPPVPPPCEKGSGLVASPEDEGASAGFELRRAERDSTTLRFSRYRDVAGSPWPHRVTLDSEEAHAVVDIAAVGQGPLPPVPPTERQVAGARRVTARELADALGIDRSAVGGKESGNERPPVRLPR